LGCLLRRPGAARRRGRTMPDLTFRVEDAEPVAHAVAPLLALRLAVENRVEGEAVHGGQLSCQIRIEPAARSYDEAEEQRLVELFDRRERYHETQRSMLWTHVPLTLPAFTGRAKVTLEIPCGFDFNVAATKYLHGVSSGVVPLLLLYSGSVFYGDPLQI